jgi:hypothetical protein
MSPRLKEHRMKTLEIVTNLFVGIAAQTLLVGLIVG